MNGFLNVLKPPGMTSHDVVNVLRKLWPSTKIGHGGTLDPGAAGVLPLLLGKATKLAPYLLEFPKKYRAELFLGITTDTGDASGKVIERKPPPILTQGEMEKAFSLFVGDMVQVPPMFSAVKKNGRKLYEYARKGLEVERSARKVKIYEITVIDYFPPERVLFDLMCSSGTYVRSLCENIGQSIGCGGHMSFLLRTASGSFQLDTCLTLEETGLLMEGCLLPADFPFREHTVILEKIQLKHFFYKQYIPLSQLLLTHKGERSHPVDGRLLAVYTTEGEFTALGRWIKATGDGEYVLKLEKRWCN